MQPTLNFRRFGRHTSLTETEKQRLESQVLNHESTALRTSGKGRRVAEARAVIAFAVREAPQLTLAALGARMQRDATTLSASIERLLTRPQQGNALAMRFARARRQILK